ncbi:unnamed protein product [Gadus morhua 'NCC']
MACEWGEQGLKAPPPAAGHCTCPSDAPYHCGSPSWLTGVKAYRRATEAEEDHGDGRKAMGTKTVVVMTNYADEDYGEEEHGDEDYDDEDSGDQDEDTVTFQINGVLTLG